MLLGETETIESFSVRLAALSVLIESTTGSTEKLRFALAEEYDGAAVEYDSKWSAYTNATCSFALSQLTPLPPDATVLDLACGTGALLRALEAGSRPDGGRESTESEKPSSVSSSSGRLGEYIGLDNSAAMLTAAEAACAACATPKRWVHSAADAPLPLPDASCDAVLTANSFHFFGDRSLCIREAARVLKPGGVLLVADWSADFLSCRLLELWLRLSGRPTAPVLRGAELRALVEATPGLRVEAEGSAVLLVFWGFMTLLARKEQQDTTGS